MNVCQPGSNLLSAGYCMYSSSVILVLSIGKGVRASCAQQPPAAAAHRAALAPPDAPRAPAQVYGFTLDQQVGEFVLSHNNIKIPESGKIYSFNEGNYAMWSPGLKKYMDSLKVRTCRSAWRRQLPCRKRGWLLTRHTPQTGGAKNDGKPYSARYIGSLVGDFHRTMLYGGIYGACARA